MLADAPGVRAVTAARAAGPTAALLVAAAASGQWTDVADAFLADGAARSKGAAWGDFDGDGRLDLVWLNETSEPSRLARNEGDGTFSDATPAPLTVLMDTSLPLAGDYDNDGDLDLFVGNFNDPSIVLRNDGGLAFTDVGAVAPIRVRARGAAWVDHDLDGRLDLLVSTNAVIEEIGEDKLYLNGGGDVFLDASPAFLGEPNVGRGVTWADFDDDGDLDLYAAAGNGCPCNWEVMPATWPPRAENRMFRNDGAGVFTDVTDPLLENPDNTRGVAAGDYDNDGDLDLYVVNVPVEGAIEGPGNVGPIGGHNLLLRNDGGFAFTDVTTTELRMTGGQRTAAWVDHDNDGDLDLHVVSMTGASRLFRNDGGGAVFTSVDEAVFGEQRNSGTSGAWADYDDDGDLDVFVSYKFDANRLLRNDLANGHHWLQVTLEGVTSNRGGVGARIRVEAGGTSQVREVTTGTGYWSQHMPARHFGLGPHAGVDVLEVRWPSGVHQVRAGLSADRRVHLVEPRAGDTNEDGAVDVVDLLALFGRWGICVACPEDVNGDGRVDVTDLLAVLANWG
ncbi:MAG: FG-GAP-like repeat-containing protein [Planctomycetota bacterium]|jgi:hypothetical protein